MPTIIFIDFFPKKIAQNFIKILRDQRQILADYVENSFKIWLL